MSFFFFTLLESIIEVNVSFRAFENISVLLYDFFYIRYDKKFGVI